MPRWPWTALAALVALALTACGARQHGHDAGEYLAGIKLEGNHALRPSDIIPGLALEKTAEAGRAFDPYVLQLDVTRVRGAYLRIGYFNVDVSPRVDRAGDATTVVFVIREGERAKTKIELIGLPTDDPAVAPEKLRALVKLADGAPFDYDAYDDAKETLLAAIEDAGYAHAQLSATVLADKQTQLATGRYIFDPGERCTFGAIQVSGAPGDLEAAVRARLSIKTGGLYSASAIATSQRALYELGRFSTVRIDPDIKTPGNAIAVKVSVALGTRYEEKVGGGLEYEPLTWDVNGRYGYSVAGCISELTTCAIDLQPAVTVTHPGDLTPDFSQPEPKIRALATLQRQDFLHPYVKGEAELGYDYLTIEAYTYTGPHARLGLSVPLAGKWLLARVGWLWALYEFINIDSNISTPDRDRLGLTTDAFSFFNERLGVYQQSLVIDLRDNPIEPTRGLYAEARVAEGTELAGGAFDYVQITPDVRAYVPLGSFVLATRVRFGEFFGDAPATERYFAGGASSQRGFSERAMSPTLATFSGPNNTTSPIPTVPGEEPSDAVPVGGTELFETSAELRSPPLLGLPIAAVAFVDGGDNIDRAISTLDLHNLNWATGGGLRFRTPFGAIRIDVGYRLNRTTSLDPEPLGSLRPFAVHFGIGEAY